MPIFVLDMIVSWDELSKDIFCSLFERFLKVCIKAKLILSLLHFSHQFSNAAFMLLPTCGQSGKTDKNASSGYSMPVSSLSFSASKALLFPLL